MVKYTEFQNRIVATGHTVVSCSLVLLFVGVIVWCILKALAFASPAVIPVVTGFFLALFFKPYYLWWEKRLHYRSLAVLAMLVTVLVPLSILVWFVGATIVNEITDFIRQIPDLFASLMSWLGAKCPTARDVLGQFQSAFAKASDANACIAAPTAEAVAPSIVFDPSVSNTVGSVVSSVDVAVVPTATNCASTTLPSIDYGKLSELYAKYGDTIKNAGMSLYQAGAAKTGAVGAGGGAASMVTAASASATSAAGADALGSGSGGLAVAFASCRSALMSAGASVLGFFQSLLYVLVTAVFFVFFLTTKNCRGGKIVEFVPMLNDVTRRFVAKQIDAVIEILVSFFQRQVAICLLEGCYYGIGFWLVGLPYGFFMGFMLGVLNLIPFFGSLVCLPLALTVAYFGAGGSGIRVLLVLVVWVLGLALDGYYVTPKIQGDRTGLGYAGVIFSFLFWPMLLGSLLGLLLAIPFSACSVVVWRGVCEFLPNGERTGGK